MAQALDQPHPPVVVVLADHPDIDLWVEILGKGGYDALAKPFDSRETARIVAGAYREAMNRRAESSQRSSDEMLPKDRSLVTS
jgi:FixJ family two-component response regulator